MTWDALQIIAALCSFPSNATLQQTCQVRMIDCVNRGNPRDTVEKLGICAMTIQRPSDTKDILFYDSRTGKYR